MSITMDDSTKDYVPKDYLTYTIEETPFEDTVTKTITKAYPKDKILTIRLEPYNGDVYVPSIWAERDACRFWRSCQFCEYNDGNVYTSYPPKYRCTIDGKFRNGRDECPIKFVPLRTGHWISHGSYFTCSVCGEEQYGVDTGRYYCQNCGAKMEIEDERTDNS